MKLSRNNRPISQRCTFRDRASRLVSIGLLLLMLMLWTRSIRGYRALRCRELRYVIGKSSGERLRDCGLYNLLYQFVMRGDLGHSPRLHPTIETKKCLWKRRIMFKSMGASPLREMGKL